MSNIRKRFKVFYFTGDYWSAKGEKRHSVIIRTRSESEAEYIFKRDYPNRMFGWVEEFDKED